MSKPAPCDPWDRAVADFHTHLKARGFSKRTIPDYLHYARAFARWCGEKNIQRPDHVTREDIQNYQHDLFKKCHFRIKDRPLSMTTQGSYLNAVKSLYRYLVMSETVMYDPTSHLVLPRRAKNLPRVVLSKRELTKLFQQPDTSTPLGYRDRAVMELFYATGMRAAELTNLKIMDVDVGRAVVMIREGKGRKDRVVPMGEVAAEWMEGYLRNVRPHLLRRPCDLVFPTCAGNQLNDSNLIHRLEIHTKRAGLKKRITCHTFRHTCATHMLRRGADLRTVQKLLGHADISTTEKYLHLDATDLIRAHRKFHPRERL